MRYTNYTNLDARWGRPYGPGDRLVRGYSGEITDVLGGARPHRTGDVTMLEAIFRRHNLDDRPDGRLCPSMSVGDVVVLGELAWSVDAFGFVGVALDPADLITDRSWRETVL